jgi:hypothetical protein
MLGVTIVSNGPGHQKEPSHASALLRNLQCTFRDGQNGKCSIGEPVECVGI